MKYISAPMKTIILSFIFILSSAFADDSTAHYKLREGKLHKGGAATVKVLPHKDLFIVKMNYQIYKRGWVPVPDDQLKGETVIELPAAFKDERGYLELETRGTMSVPDAELKFIRRTNLGKYKDAFEAMVLPKNGRSKIEVIYHPDIPGAGWGQVRTIFISDIPLLNGYQAIADLKD